MILFSLIIIAAVIIIDQITKVIVYNDLRPLETVNLIKIADKEVLNLTYCENTGAAFGIFKNGTLALLIVTTIVLAVMAVYLYKTKITNKIFNISIAMVIGGGIGNNIDRLFRGFVVDFIDFRIINFAIFNFADICIVLGIIICFIYLIFFDESYKAKPCDKKGNADE